MAQNVNLKHITYEGVKVPVIYGEDTHLPIVSMKIIFKKSGSLYDNNLSGLANISTDLLNEGTKKSGNIKFWKKVENRAIELSISSGYNFITINISSLKENFPYGIKYLNELLSDVSYSNDVLMKVKHNIISEIELNKSSYSYISSKSIKQITYNSPYNKPAIGTNESILKITLNDVKSFINKSLIRENMIVVVGGDISFNDVTKYTKNVLEKLNSGKPRKDIEPLKINTNKIMKVQKDTKQAFISFSAPINIDYKSKDLYKLSVMMFILGDSGFGSRLMEKVRVENGLAYSIYAHSNISKQSSTIAGAMQTGLKTQDKAIELTKKVIYQLTKNGATQKELDAAKKFILGSEPLKVETINDRLDRVLSNYYYDRDLNYFDEKLKKIESLTLKELNSFIKSHKEINNLNFAIVTDDKR